MLLLLLLSPVQACTGPALFCQQDLLNLQKNNPADQDYLVQTPEGQVQGRALTSAAGQTFGSWEGVPYGEQPKRWSPPELKQQWEGVLDCTDLGPICMQYALDSDPLDSDVTVYRYLHTFQDNTSYSFAGTTEWGPTHGDELPYLWILPSYGWSDTSTWSSLAKQHSQLLLSLWSSFTDSGRPSSEGVEWRPYTPGGEYLQMGDQAVMGFGEGESRFAWWRNLLEQGC